MDAEHRFLAFAGAQTALVAALTGIAGAMVLFSPLGGVGLSHLQVSTSGLGARLTYYTLWALTLVVLALYVLVPVAIAAYLLRYGDHHPVVPVGAAVVAVFGLPVAAFLPATWLGGNAAPAVATFLVVLAFLGIGGLALRRDVAGSVFAGVALLFLFGVGMFVVPFGLAEPAEDFVEQRSGGAQVAFAYEYEPASDGRGVLTVTHDGGDVVRADALVVRSDDLADVPGAEQTASGRWQGETSEVGWLEGPAVAPDDTVTVGVESDCVVRVVHRRGGIAVTLAKYTCPDSGE